MQINRATDYAIRVMIHLATLPPGSKAQLIALEHATGVRGSFLSKVMQRLVHAGFVASQRAGPSSLESRLQPCIRGLASASRSGFFLVYLLGDHDDRPMISR